MPKSAVQPDTPDLLIRKLMEPAIRVMTRRGELVCEEVFRQATNAALERAAEIAERFLVEEREDGPLIIRARLARQNKVAEEIAFRIRSEKLEEPSDAQS